MKLAIYPGEKENDLEDVMNNNLEIKKRERENQPVIGNFLEFEKNEALDILSSTFIEKVSTLEEVEEIPSDIVTEDTDISSEEVSTPKEKSTETEIIAFYIR